MGSYIQIDSIFIDLANSMDNTDTGKCEHFSIRGYVSEIRKKDWKKCWPFSVNESEEQPSLPPLDVPKFRWWSCQNCRQATTAEGIDKNDQSDFNCCSTGCGSDSNCSTAVVSSGIQQAPMPDSILVRREIDLNKSIDLSSGSDCLPISNEIENNAEVVLSRITDPEIGLENNLNHQLSRVPSPEVCPGLVQEVHTYKRGCEGNEVSKVELVTSNLKCMEKSSSEIYNEGTTTSADNQCQKELRKSCTILREGTVVTEEDNVTDHTTGHLPPESVACNHAVLASNTDNIVKNDFQDHHPEKSTGLSRKRPRKMRLLTDLLSENGGPKTERITRQGSASRGPSNASAASQTLSILPDKVDVQGDMTLTNRGQGRKRKFLVDEERKRPADMCFQRIENEVENLEGDAKTIDTVPDNRSKDVLVGIGLQDAMKGHRRNPEIERSHTMGKKKNRKIQHVDNHLISEPHQGQQRENEDTMDVANKEYASKTLSSEFFPGASTEKGMGNFPLHALRTENVPNFSKGKGKMLQAEEELDSFSCWKNDKLVEDSFAHTGAKNMSNMPVSVPIPSAQGAANGEGLEEELHRSLNCFSSAEVCNKNSIHQTENRLPFSLPLQEGTSKHQLIRKGNETNFFRERSIPSKHITNAISGKGKGVHLEEINGARNKDKTAEVVELGNMNRYCDQTVEQESEQGTFDDVPMEVVEIMARNQYERSLPDVDNVSSLLEKSTQKEKPQAGDGKNGMITRGENVFPRKGNSINDFYPFDGNRFGMNNLCKTQSPFGFEVLQSKNKPSSGVYFSQIQLGPAPPSKFNRSIAECGSSDATLQAKGGSNLHKTILQQDHEASHPWASSSKSNASLGYDAVAQPTSSNMDMISLRSGSLHKQNKKRDIDLNCPNFNATNLEKLSRNISPRTLSRTNAEYQFPGKHNGMEAHQNLRGSLDMYSNETIPAMHLLSLMDAGRRSATSFNAGVRAQMLKRPSYPGDCSTKLEIGTYKTRVSPKRQSSDYYSKRYLSDKSPDYFPDSPIFSASSSIQHDEKFLSSIDFSDRNLTKSGKREKMNSSNSAMQNKDSKQFSWPHPERETPVQQRLDVRGTRGTSEPLNSISESSCLVNRNPADFTVPEAGNAYMINGEDLRFEESFPKKRSGSPTPCGCRQKRNLKGGKMKEHEKH